MNPRAKFWTKPTFWFGFIALTPVLVWYIVLGYYPIVTAFLISLRKYNVLNPSLSRVAGLENYLNLISDSRFHEAAIHSAQYMFTKNLIAIPLALTLAILMERVRYRQFYLFLYFLPVVMSIVGVAVLFRWLYDPTIGPIDTVLRAVHLPPQSFVRSEDQALYSVAAMDAWKSFGFYTVLVLAGLLNIPGSLYDAAYVDGASNWQVFWQITLPMLVNTLILVVIIAAIDGFQVFTPVYTLPGPGRSTLVLASMIYQDGLHDMNLGYAAAVSFVLFAIILIVSTLQLRALRSQWQQ